MGTKDSKSFGARKQAWEAFVAYPGEVTFKAVFEQYYRSLYGYGMKLSGQPEVAKDAIQDLFGILWARRHELAHITSPSVYLFVSLRRTILGEVERQRGRTNGLDELPGDGFTDFGREEIIIRDEVKFEKKQKLQQALAQLTGRQQEVLYLHYYNGLSYDEVSQILSITRQSAYNHMHRAMQTLRSLLDMDIMNLVS